MPIYAYRCSACGHAQDVLQKISDPLLAVCPACGEAAYAKQVTAAGFQLKGTGWYVTDFRDGGKGAKAGAEKDAEKGTEKGAEKGIEKAADTTAAGSGATGGDKAPATAAGGASKESASSAPAAASPAPSPAAPTAGS